MVRSLFARSHASEPLGIQRSGQLCLHRKDAESELNGSVTNGASYLRIHPITVRLIPKSVHYWRAANLARRQFLENNLHHTEGDTGVLIFVSEAEHYVEILADCGIGQHVSDERWQTIVNAFVAGVRAGRALEGFLAQVSQPRALCSSGTLPPSTTGMNDQIA